MNTTLTDGLMTDRALLIVFLRGAVSTIVISRCR
jgi:hypothetical protein